jgi:transglutaminase-like putative cysteine protease
MQSAWYAVEHVTSYAQSGRAAASQHVACLQPRGLPRQIVHAHSLDVEPAPADQDERSDYFGNTLHHFAIVTPYDDMRVVSRSLVEVRPRTTTPDAALSPSWESVRDRAGFERGQPADLEREYCEPSPYVALDAELAEFARGSFPPGLPLLEGAIDLMHRIHEEFTFDPGSTTLTTPISRVLAERQGVCQDFAHLQIGCLRALGLPARYVSGYLLTDPPPGQPRLVGADASHAWLSVRCPRWGWVDLDPTNDALPDLRHVTIGWGRDYGDVSPLRGVVLGGQQQTLTVGVSVVPVPPRHART